MKYIYTIVNESTVSEMVEASSPEDALEKVNSMEFNSIASKETRNRYVKIIPAFTETPEVDLAEDAEIVSIN